MSIKLRLIVILSLVIALAFAVTGVVTVTVARDQMIARVDQSLLASPSVAPHERDENQPNPFESARRETATLVLNPDGSIRQAEPAGYADAPDPLPDLSLEDVTAHVNEIFTTGAATGADRDYRVLVRTLNGGYLIQAAPLDDVEATVESLITIVTVAGIVVVIIVIVVVWFSIRRGLRPIDDMIGTAALIAGGDLSHRVEHATETTEVGRLGRALNTMLGRIESSFSEKERSERRLRQFVADASHELRTPLTSIRGYAELFRSGAAADPATLERVMLRIESESTRMSALVEDLLLLARLDQGRPLAHEPVDLVAIAGEVVEDARVIEPDRSITFDHPDDALTLGDADRLRQVVVNLITNARVHTDPDTPIHVAVRTTERAVEVSVADEGPGMTPEDAARVFDRFYRVDVSRARSRGGSGLGLSIVASIVEAHGGQVRLESAVGRGTTVTLTLARLDRAARWAPLATTVVPFG